MVFHYVKILWNFFYIDESLGWTSKIFGCHKIMLDTSYTFRLHT